MIQRKRHHHRRQLIETVPKEDSPLILKPNDEENSVDIPKQINHNNSVQHIDPFKDKEILPTKKSLKGKSIVEVIVVEPCDQNTSQACREVIHKKPQKPYKTEKRKKDYKYSQNQQYYILQSTERRRKSSDSSKQINQNFYKNDTQTFYEGYAHVLLGQQQTTTDFDQSYNLFSLEDQDDYFIEKGSFKNISYNKIPYLIKLVMENDFSKVKKLLFRNYNAIKSLYQESNALYYAMSYGFESMSSFLIHMNIMNYFPHDGFLTLSYEQGMIGLYTLGIRSYENCDFEEALNLNLFDIFVIMCERVQRRQCFHDGNFGLPIILKNQLSNCLSILRRKFRLINTKSVIDLVIKYSTDDITGFALRSGYYDDSLLVHLVQTGNLRVVKHIFKYSKRMNIKTNVPNLLHYAIDSGYQMFLLVLKQNKFQNVTIIHDCDTLLTRAIKSGVRDTVVNIIEMGVSVMMPNRDGKYPLQICCTPKLQFLIPLLISHGADPNVLGDPKLSNRMNITDHSIRSLISAGAQNVNFIIAYSTLPNYNIPYTPRYKWY